ncbi:MAG: hypothetical protein ACREPP_08945, partial [Rhodanobacteraceae bacterium]
TGAPGVHFQDHPELQGLWLPEWSHLATRDAVRFTGSLYAVIERDIEHRAHANPIARANASRQKPE